MYECGRGADPFKLCEIPSIVLRWVMSRVVRRRDVRDAFWVYADMAVGVESSREFGRDWHIGEERGIVDGLCNL